MNNTRTVQYNCNMKKNFEFIKDKFKEKKKIKNDKSWTRFFPTASKLLSLETLQKSLLEEIAPIKNLAFPKSKEQVYRTITSVAIINAVLAGLPGKMGVGVYISISLEIAMAVAIANYLGLHQIKKENILKYLGTAATVLISILVLFKEMLSFFFSIFTSISGPLNPMIPAELLVTNIYGIMFVVGFKEMKQKGSFRVPIRLVYSILKESYSLTKHQLKLVKNKPPELFKKIRKKIVKLFTGDVELPKSSNSEIRGDVFPVLATAHLLDKNFESLKGPLGQKYIEAVRLSFPEKLGPDASLDQIRNHLMTYEPETLNRLININIKGKLFEVLKVTSENADGDDWTAKAHPDINHPGTDITLTNSETGEKIEVQLKSTFSKSYVETEMEKNPDTIFIVSDEVAKQINDPRVIPAGITNEKTTQLAKEKTQDLINGKLDASDLIINPALGGVASGSFNLFPYLVAYKKNKITKDEFNKVMETLVPQASQNTIELIAKYSVGGLIYLWWRPAKLIINSIYEDELPEKKDIKNTSAKGISRRDFIKLAFVPILR